VVSRQLSLERESLRANRIVWESLFIYVNRKGIALLLDERVAKKQNAVIFKRGKRRVVEVVSLKMCDFERLKVKEVKGFLGSINL
jgi:hypothetical protein